MYRLRDNKGFGIRNFEFDFILLRTHNYDSQVSQQTGQTLKKPRHKRDLFPVYEYISYLFCQCRPYFKICPNKVLKELFYILYDFWFVTFVFFAFSVAFRKSIGTTFCGITVCFGCAKVLLFPQNLRTDAQLVTRPVFTRDIYLNFAHLVTPNQIHNAIQAEDEDRQWEGQQKCFSTWKRSKNFGKCVWHGQIWVWSYQLLQWNM